MMDETTLPAEVADLRPVAKHIYHYLSSEGVAARSQSDLIAELGYSEKSVREATRDLTDAGLFRKRLHPDDARSRLYEPADDTLRD